MSRTPEWVWKMHAEVAKYAIPFTFGRPPRPSEEPDIHAGTCVAVETAEARFIITARHVAEPAREAAQDAAVQCLAGSVKLDVRGQLRLSEPVLDLATVQLSNTQMQLIEREGYRVVRPDRWPPVSEIGLNDPVLVVGFPGSWRIHVTWDQIDFRSVTKLALIHQLQPREFACQLDPAFVDQYEAEHAADLASEQLPGMSGGPGFLVRQGLLVVPRLCGIIKQGWDLGDGNQIIYFAPMTAIRPDGGIDD
jgi:hypothetical protein